MYKIKNILCGIYLIIFPFDGLIAQNNGDQILGKWVNETKTRTVEVFKNNGKYSAKIIDSINKKEEGKLIVWGLQYQPADKEWSNGEVQLPDMTHSASCYAVLKGKKIIITGFHGLRYFGNSETYNRKE
jgi:hypothetical protein